MLSTTMAPLARYPRWINWRFDADARRPDKPRKVPISPRTGYGCKPNDPANWCTYEEALAAAQARQHGLGFVFQEGDGLWFLDIDGALQPDGTWSPLARHLLEVWQGHAAIEVSQSGTGLHIFGWASDIPEHGCRNIPLKLELYHHERFVAFTDYMSAGAIDADTSHILAGVVASYFPKTSASRDVVDWTDTGAPHADGAHGDDGELLQIMLRSGKKSAVAMFNAENHVTFEDLWTANADKLSRKWPGQNGHDSFDRSSADSALASLLVFWTAGNCERVERFMRRSALAREKWDEREDYLERTILGACSTVSKRAGPRDVGGALTAAPNPTNASVTSSGALTTSISIGGAPVQVGEPTSPVSNFAPRSAATILSVEEHSRLFAGCVYLVTENKIWVPTLGDFVNKDRFNVLYGGRSFVVRNDGKACNNAWEAFTDNTQYKPAMAKGIYFNPKDPSGHVRSDGRINSWFPESTPETPGDASPFVNHVRRILPHGDDAAILLTYLASTIRNPGVKNQWWPVVQGAQGNGKTLLNLVMQHAIGRRYSHLARASSLAKTGMQFNSWVTGRLYLGLEEISLGDKRDFLEDIKDIVTNTTVAVEAKGKDQTLGDNYINGLMLTNHMDAVPVTRGDRRYCILYCAQQAPEDLTRDGLTSEYFAELYDWMNGRGRFAELGQDYGFRVVSYYLRHVHELDARYNPSGLCQRAPKTTSTETAYVQSLGHVEQEVMERVHGHVQGFANGWISSSALDVMLGNIRVRMSRTRRTQLVAGLGYAPHPALPGGRAPRAVGYDVPILYIRAGHPALNLQDPEVIVRAYEQAQTGLGGAAGLVAA